MSDGILNDPFLFDGIAFFKGFGFTLAVWLFLYGLNVPVREWMIRRHLARCEVAEQVEVVYQPLRVKWARLLWVLPVWLFVNMGVLWGFSSIILGALVALLVVAALWRAYVCSPTCTKLLLVFDRKGLTVFPVRRRLLSQGTFRTRLNWVDCFGYSIYKGHLLFALRAGGQIEQVVKYSPQIVETLHRLGVRKLKSYDLLELREVSEEALQLLEQQVLQMVQDIVSSHQADAAAMGLHLQAEVQYGDDSEAQNEPYAFLKMSLWQEEQMVDELDWLLWARYEKEYEVLHLPKERLYESLDERVVSLLEAQMREQGLAMQPTRLQ